MTSFDHYYQALLNGEMPAVDATWVRERPPLAVCQQRLH